MNTSEILNSAADLIESKGWCQGAYARNASGHPCQEWDRGAKRFCAIGAINKAASRLKAANEAKSAARLELIRVIDDTMPIGWNDDPARTKEEVIAAFRAAAKEAANA